MRWQAKGPYTRLDKWLSGQVADCSRSQIQKAIKEGAIRVNGEVSTAKYQLTEGDLVEWEMVAEKEIELIPESIAFERLYEDKDILVINKPAGLVVHPSKGHPHGTLVNGLLGLGIPLANRGEAFRPGIVHRLDKDTSGLMLVAKSNQAYDRLVQQLKDRQVHRYYLALVSGIIDEESGQINAPIRRSSSNRLKRAVDKEGREALTQFGVIERFHQATLVQCRLETGRTHQIRVHMAFIGHPLLNDPLYGRGPLHKGLREGQALHAYHLAFRHPITGEAMTFECDLPQDLQNYLDQLRRSEL